MHKHRLETTLQRDCAGQHRPQLVRSRVRPKPHGDEATDNRVGLVRHLESAATELATDLGAALCPRALHPLERLQDESCPSHDRLDGWLHVPCHEVRRHDRSLSLRCLR